MESAVIVSDAPAVRFPYMRREIVRSIAALGDVAHQHRVWVQQQLPFPGYYDELDLRLHILYDDMSVLPEPGPEDGTVLLPGGEAGRLRTLGVLLDEVTDRLGAALEVRYLADARWPSLVTAAQLCLSALVLAGGWECADADVRTYHENLSAGRIPTVTLPATRRRVIKAVAALADAEYHRRTWTNTDAEPTTDADPVTGSLAACLRTLTDDAHVLPDPRSAIGQVLLAGDEIDRLATLRDALEPFREDPPAQPWLSSGWPTVVTAALRCLPALVIAGAWIGQDQPAAGH